MFSSEFCEISKNTFSYRTPLVDLITSRWGNASGPEVPIVIKGMCKSRFFYLFHSSGSNKINIEVEGV